MYYLNTVEKYIKHQIIIILYKSNKDLGINSG